jgi:hypothetical protein
MLETRAAAMFCVGAMMVVQRGDAYKWDGCPDVLSMLRLSDVGLGSQNRTGCER